MRKMLKSMIALLLVAGITITMNTSFANENMKSEMGKMNSAPTDRLELEAVVTTMKTDHQLLKNTLQNLEEQHHTAKEAGNQELITSLDASIETTKQAIKMKQADIMTLMKSLKKQLHLELGSETIMKNMKLKKEISKMFPEVTVMAPEDIYAKGHKLNFKAPPIMRNNEIMIPLRTITDAFGATLVWHAETKSATITKDENTIKLHLGSDIAHVNGDEMKLKSSITSIRGNMFVPLNFMAEVLNIELESYEDISMYELSHKMKSEQQTTITTEPNTPETTTDEHKH